ncbi:MAG: hypothetical protein AAF206_25130 [Bacteroidota bacterium]
MKYTKEDILEMLLFQYRFQVVFDPEVDDGMGFDFESSIRAWREACDLLGPQELAKIYQWKSLGFLVSRVRVR